ncbi:DNA-formamidopyrimidine glycosylase family protein [Microbacterium ulmi]|uniref:Fpg/Nei family DNA glycosylase n=1 Tax=Microbacterium ulmi TaxID=179095 RepID=A0A7Y2M3Y5_9MICO|nr:DNA-formamidopyrimidine glycosylase family protein [Microbacterium ulmi]NII71444.1 formamidopyrimidine-DNA glycosylase [Microbacterium ulmi]NNH04653.1 Fpg/Nei family DNA glycosylase [Microbacterium ulmi]
MPESPEVQALADSLRERLSGREVTAVDVLEFRTVRTRARPLGSLVGHRLRASRRFGKHVALGFDATNLVVSLGRHGWARLNATVGAAQPAGGPPALASLLFDDGSVLELTDAGTWVSIGLSVVDDPADVAAIAKLGPDPADASFTRAVFATALAGRRKQIKAILQEQESIAGIGNAYSDEILHAAKVSPIAHATTLGVVTLDQLYDATVATVRDAIAARRGIPIDELKAAKVAAMRVHGRAGRACPVCGDLIRSFTFASATAEYCPTCQTGGAIL